MFLLYQKRSMAFSLSLNSFSLFGITFAIFVAGLTERETIMKEIRAWVVYIYSGKTDKYINDM
jgi:predicted DNA-binding transcriptional regulator